MAIMTNENRNDPINHPLHYTFGSIESIDYIESCGFGYAFEIGNVLKYLTRAEHKGSKLEDLKKARWYLDRVIQLTEKENAAHSGRQGGQR